MDRLRQVERTHLTNHAHWPSSTDAISADVGAIQHGSAESVQVAAQELDAALIGHATVFVEPLGGVNAAGTIAALNRHRGFLRGELGRRIELKFTPELRFVEDTSFAEAERIARIFHSEKVARDLSTPDNQGEDTQ